MDIRRTTRVNIGWDKTDSPESHWDDAGPRYFSCDVWKGSRRDTFAISLVLHIIAIGAIAKLATSVVVTEKKLDMSHSVTLVAPMPLRVTTAVPPPPRVVAPPVPVRMEPVHRPEPQIAVQAPKLNAQVTKLDIPAPVRPPEPMPRSELKPGGFDPPKNTVVTTTKPAREVQTGGFGDPNGVPGQGKPKAALTIASLGSFDLPAGSGAGNGSGGAHGVRGTVTSAGFGSGVNGSTPGAGKPQRSVAQAGFTDATVVAAGPARTRAVAPRTTPVEILYKPRPVYTAEARSLRIEGEVLLDIVFLANGSLRLGRVVSGLGHGLDEAAMQAAQRIRFRPATQDGQPCDSNATVHIVFQLAE